MNPDLDRLQTYPFQKLNTLLQDVVPAADRTPIKLYIGEPKHPAPEFIRRTLADNLAGLGVYPTTLGGEDLRIAIAQWLKRRHGLADISADSEIIPVSGSREALFALAQAVVDRTLPAPAVVSPNPFYQIYEGAALLAGAQLYFVNMLHASNFAFDYEQLSETQWKRVQLVYTCSPANPTGHVMSLDEWRRLFEMSDRYGFVIAADECYSEIYFDEAHPPLGALAAAQQCGRSGYPRLVIFSSLSKRSSLPGMRSGFVAGDAQILKKFLLYRTYQGCTMSPPIHAASTVAWTDEAHVVENRRLYGEKFAAAIPVLRAAGSDAIMPEGGFYLWLRTPCDDTAFTRELYRSENVSVLPGRYLARPAHGINPGENYVRIALVASTAECTDAAHRIAAVVRRGTFEG